MNAEIQKIIARVKKVQAKVHKIIRDEDWLEEALKYAEKQRPEIKKILSSENVAKLESFVQKQRKELERFQKELPKQVDKLRTRLKTQRREFETILRNIGKAEKRSASKKKKTTRGKSAGRKKKASS